MEASDEFYHLANYISPGGRQMKRSSVCENLNCDLLIAVVYGIGTTQGLVIKDGIHIASVESVLPLDWETWPLMADV